MFIGFGDLIKIAILIVGILWCKEIFGRFRSDLAEFKNSKDSTARPVILFFWAITLGFILFALNFVWGLVKRFIWPMGR
jgi:hypothetical protein